MTEVRSHLANRSNLLAVVLVALVVAYIGWKITESPEQALQFAFNGMSVGAIYALVAMGFTIVYSTVWFFDMYYGAAAALGAYGVFTSDLQRPSAGCTRSTTQSSTASSRSSWPVWSYGCCTPPSTTDFERASATNSCVPAVESWPIGAGAYTGAVLTFPSNLHITLAPVITAIVALVIVGSGRELYTRTFGTGRLKVVTVVAAIIGIALGVVLACGSSNLPGSKLYLSWGVSCFLAGVVSLALYRDFMSTCVDEHVLRS